jgi:HAD superfamily hydrolase (TIGR01490 family)
MQRLAIYDMDKTITRRATWTPFLTRYAREKPWDGIGLSATPGPVILYALKLIDRARLKELTQWLVMGRRPRVAEVERIAALFAEQVAAENVYAEARAQIAADRADRCRIVIATASYDFYVRPIAAALGIEDVVATRSTIEGDRMVPRITGENCYGPAKLRMIEAWLAAQGIQRGEANIRFYSDHVSDAPTLDWADEAFAVNPHKPLADLAQAKGWTVLDWRERRQRSH